MSISSRIENPIMAAYQRDIGISIFRYGSQQFEFSLEKSSVLVEIEDDMIAQVTVYWKNKFLTYLGDNK